MMPLEELRPKLPKIVIKFEFEACRTVPVPLSVRAWRTGEPPCERRVCGVRGDGNTAFVTIGHRQRPPPLNGSSGMGFAFAAAIVDLVTVLPVVVARRLQCLQVQPGTHLAVVPGVFSPNTEKSNSLSQC